MTVARRGFGRALAVSVLAALALASAVAPGLAQATTDGRPGVAAAPAQLVPPELLNLTPALALSLVKGLGGPSGFQLGAAGVPCGGSGQACRASGAVSGTITGSSAFTVNLTASVPAATSVTLDLASLPDGILGSSVPPSLLALFPPGSVITVGATGVTPVAVFSTTAGLAAATCATPAGTPGSTYTCSSTASVSGALPLQGSSVALCFTVLTPCLLGGVSGPGLATPVATPQVRPAPSPLVAALALPPLPVLPPPLPPPPPPPLPPPQMLAPLPPPIARPAAPPTLGAPPAAAGVPIVPEADSLGLLLAGLAAVGAVAAAHPRRRGKRIVKDEEQRR